MAIQERELNFVQKTVLFFIGNQTCAERYCPVRNRGKTCKLKQIASTTKLSVIDLIDPDVIKNRNKQKMFHQKHCINLVRRYSGWEDAKVNEKNGSIEM